MAEGPDEEPTLFRGTVQRWSDDEGWGVVVSPELDGTAFAHNMHIRGQEGYRSFADGDAVMFELDGSGRGQDGCDYRVEWVELASSYDAGPSQVPPSELRIPGPTSEDFNGFVAKVTRPQVPTDAGEPDPPRGAIRLIDKHPDPDGS